MREIRQSGSEGGAKRTFVPTPIIAWAVRPRETSPSRSSAEGAVDFENRSNPRDNVRDGSGLGQFAGIAGDNKATISVAPSALLAFVSHSLGLTAQAIIVSALRASSLLHSETGSKADSADLFCRTHAL
jgi:hypothetical protein